MAWKMGPPEWGRDIISRSVVIACALSTILAACAAPRGPLPHALYFLEGRGENAQVWRLERDGVTRLQLTNEAAGVDEFAVSPADGSLAFVSGNQLFLMDGSGEARRLVAGEGLAEQGGEGFYYHKMVGSPVFSPDGHTLAYALDGLHLYHLSSGEDEHVLANLGNLLGEAFVFSKELYSPGPWSPDGSKLLIVMGYYEGSTLAVMDLEAEQPFTRLRSTGPVCCTFAWSEDSQSVLVANPSYTGDLPGLWRYNAQTGVEVDVIPGMNENGSINFVGWPHQPASGELVLFHVNLERFSPDVGIPLSMARSNLDGTELLHIRTEEFQIIDAIWERDGSLVVISGRVGDANQLILARTDESPLQVLIEDGQLIRNFMWGP